MDYILKTSLDENEELALTLTERKSRGYPAENFADIDYADDIALASKINVEKNRIYKYKPKKQPLRFNNMDANSRNEEKD